MTDVKEKEMEEGGNAMQSVMWNKQAAENTTSVPVLDVKTEKADGVEENGDDGQRQTTEKEKEIKNDELGNDHVDVKTNTTEAKDNMSLPVDVKVPPQNHAQLDSLQPPVLQVPPNKIEGGNLGKDNGVKHENIDLNSNNLNASVGQSNEKSVDPFKLKDRTNVEIAAGSVRVQQVDGNIGTAKGCDVEGEKSKASDDKLDLFMKDLFKKRCYWDLRTEWEADECARIERESNNKVWEDWLGFPNRTPGKPFSYVQSFRVGEKDEQNVQQRNTVEETLANGCEPNSAAATGNGISTKNGTCEDGNLADAGTMLKLRALIYESEVARLKMYEKQKEERRLQCFRKKEEDLQQKEALSTKSIHSNANGTLPKAQYANLNMKAPRRTPIGILNTLATNQDQKFSCNLSGVFDSDEKDVTQKESPTNVVVNALRDDIVYYPLDITFKDVEDLQKDGSFEKKYINTIEIREAEATIKPKSNRGARELSGLLSDVPKSARSASEKQKVTQKDSTREVELQVQQKMANILIILKDQKDTSEPFLKKVSKSQKFAPGYYDMIKEPMDLGTMTKKLKAGKYKTKELFKYDLDLIFNNCRIYNGPKTKYVQYANKLEEIANKLLVSLPDFDLVQQAEKVAAIANTAELVDADHTEKLQIYQVEKVVGAEDNANKEEKDLNKDKDLDLQEIENLETRQHSETKASSSGKNSAEEDVISCKLIVRDHVHLLEGMNGLELPVEVQIFIKSWHPKYEGYEYERRWRERTFESRMEREAIRRVQATKPFGDQTAFVRTVEGMAHFNDDLNNESTAGFFPEYSYIANSIPLCPPTMPSSSWCDNCSCNREKDEISDEAANNYCGQQMSRVLNLHFRRVGLDGIQTSAMNFMVELLKSRISHYASLATTVEEREGQLTPIGRGQLVLLSSKNFGNQKPISAASLKTYLQSLKRREKLPTKTSTPKSKSRQNQAHVNTGGRSSGTNATRLPSTTNTNSAGNGGTFISGVQVKVKSGDTVPSSTKRKAGEAAVDIFGGVPLSKKLVVDTAGSKFF